jgi:hypothetical protein
MNTSRLLAMEFLVAVGMSSWAAIKGDGKTRYWPWPPTIVLTGVAFGLLGMLAIPQPRLASVLGSGFLLAQVVRALGKGDFFDLSGIPKSNAFKQYNEKYDGTRYYRILTL